jgi:dsRNA-specific ribonuclease
VDEWEKKPGTRDFKSLLQEVSQDRFKEIPRYRTAGVSGPDHDRTFEVEASIGDILTATGTGKSKKEAEQDAARAALEKLDAT